MIIPQDIDQYVYQNTQPEPELLQELIKVTHAKTQAPQMLSGRSCGRLLKFLTQISNSKKVLEIGTFTGYSALCMAEGLPTDGKIITCDVDEHCTQIAQDFFSRSPHGHKIQVRLGKALDTIADLKETFDFVFIDADKNNYPHYYEAVLPKLKKGGLIVVDNCLWSGAVLNPQDAQTRSIHALNQIIAQDSRVENVFLTIRDGWQVVLKK